MLIVEVIDFADGSVNQFGRWKGRLYRKRGVVWIPFRWWVC